MVGENSLDLIFLFGDSKVNISHEATKNYSVFNIEHTSLIGLGVGMVLCYFCIININKTVGISFLFGPVFLLGPGLTLINLFIF